MAREHTFNHNDKLTFKSHTTEQAHHVFSEARLERINRYSEFRDKGVAWKPIFRINDGDDR